jgi:hypothetical protein
MTQALTDQGIRERQRLAWIVLLSSFFICMVVTVSTPFLINAMLQSSVEPLDVFVQANQGTVRIDNANGIAGAILAGDPGRLVDVGSTVVTGNTQTALVFLAQPESEQRLARLQVYSNTIIRLVQAETPRFSISDESHAVTIKLDSGRLLLSLSEFDERPLNLFINTPQGQITFNRTGEYSVIVTNEATQVTVSEGEAVVSAVVEEGVRDVVYLQNNQRAEIPTGQSPRGPLTTDRNLILNSDFSAGKNGWTFFAWNIEQADQPRGETAVSFIFGEPRLQIIREGIGHADLRIRQSIQQDVSDLAALQFSLTFRILGQSLQVCGVVGSECPLFVRINYIDTNGFSKTWQQGFYGSGEINPSETPDACIRCDVVQFIHGKAPLNQDAFFETDLYAEIARQGFLPPRYIESIELVASGHSFNVEIVDINLIAIE